MIGRLEAPKLTQRVRVRFEGNRRFGLKTVKPADNAYVQSFNGRLCDVCTNTRWFKSISESKQQIEARRRDYYESRPHLAPGERTPEEFAALMRRNEDQ